MGRFSPNGEQAVFDSRSGDLDLWLWDFTRKAPQRRLTFTPSSDQYPVWSSDGKYIFYTNPGKDGWDVFRRNADETGEPYRVARMDTSFHATAITRDGKTLILHTVQPNQSFPQGIYTLGTSGDAKPQLLIPGTDGNAINAHLSDDSKWIAYQLEKGARSEVIVHPFPNLTGGRWQVSDWGTHPVFNRDELFYRDRDRRLVSVRLHFAPRLVVESPIVVLENVFLPGPGRPYDVSPDGQKFIVVNETRVEQTAGRPLQLNFALNWLEDVKRRTRGGN
jgi:Tol biopolymer transport system component